MSLTAADRKWIRTTVRDMLKSCAQDLYDSLTRDEHHGDVVHIGGTTCATYVHDDNDGARRNRRRLGFHVAPLPKVTVDSSVTPDAGSLSADPSHRSDPMNN